MRFTLKRKLLEGKQIVGCFLNYYAPALVETIGMTGCDFFVLDNEHGSFSPSEMENMIRAADSVGMATIVRVDYDNSSIQKALDMGAEGVQIPKVNSRQDAELAVMRAKYPPQGDRGVGFSARCVRVSEIKGAAYLKEANENVLVIAQIETPDAIENLPDILAVPGIDVAFLGKMDLSTAVGTPRDVSSPVMLELTARFFDETRKAGVISGYIHDNSVSLAEAKKKNSLYIATVAGLSGNVQATVKERNDNC